MENENPQDITAKVEAWMRDASNDIDVKLGLPRVDQAIDWASLLIAKHYEAAHQEKAKKRKSL